MMYTLFMNEHECKMSSKEAFWQEFAPRVIVVKAVEVKEETNEFRYCTKGKVLHLG